MSALNPVGAVGAVRSAMAGRGLEAAQHLRTLKELEPQPGMTLQAPASAPPDFSATFKEVLGEVNDLQLKSEELLEQFATGEVQNLHDVVIAQQEAAIAFRLVQEVRDRLLQGYQELMRMQV
jgi:flagellar hook-basal body complex protein FliE